MTIIDAFQRSSSLKSVEVPHSAHSRGRSVRLLSHSNPSQLPQCAAFESLGEREFSTPCRAPQRLVWDLEAVCVVKNVFLSACAPSSRSAARSGAPEGASHAADSTPRIYMPCSLQWPHYVRLRERVRAPAETKPRVIESLVDPAPGGRARGAG